MGGARILCVKPLPIASLVPRGFLSIPHRSWKVPPRGLMLPFPSARDALLDIHAIPPPFLQILAQKSLFCRGLPPQQSNLNSLLLLYSRTPVYIYFKLLLATTITSYLGFPSHQTINFLGMGGSSGLLIVFLTVSGSGSGSE